MQSAICSIWSVNSSDFTVQYSEGELPVGNALHLQMITGKPCDYIAPVHEHQVHL